MRLRRVEFSAPVLVALALTATLGLGGCGSSKRPAGDTVHGDTLDIYTALPLSGSDAAGARAIVRAERLALAQIHNRIGRYKIDLVVRDDTGGNTQGWNAPQAAAAAQDVAREAAADPRTVAFIGDETAGASAVTIPILNRRGIAQVTPSATAVGLTSDGIGSSPGEPQAYYPEQLRTFARVLGTDGAQAAVQAELQRQSGCRTTYVLDDGEYDGEAMVQAFDQIAPEHGLQVVSTQSYVVGAKDYYSVGKTIAESHASCVLLAATSDHNAVKLATEIAEQVPHLKLFVTMSLAQASFVNPAQGGIPLWLDSRVTLTATPLEPASKAAAAQTFLNGFGRQAAEQEPLAAGGYQAMASVLRALEDATDGGHRTPVRTHIVGALFDGVKQTGLFGPFKISADGDASIDSFGVYAVSRGKLRYERSISGTA